MNRPDPGPTIHTFVIRFWRERSVAGAHWRGWIEHVQSGQRAAFLDLTGMTAFIQRFGIMAPAESQPDKADSSPTKAGQIGGMGV